MKLQKGNNEIAQFSRKTQKIKAQLMFASRLINFVHITEPRLRFNHFVWHCARYKSLVYVYVWTELY